MSTQPTSISYREQEFLAISGSQPRFEVALSNDNIAFAHGAGIYFPHEDCVLVTSNITSLDPANPERKSVIITECKRGKDGQWAGNDIPVDICFPDGCASYRKGLIFAQRGNFENPSALVFIPSLPPYTPTVLLDSFNGRKFNSVSEVAVHPSDGSIWFTDPAYGYEQGLRPHPELPCQVYRFDETGDVRAMADSFDMPKSLCWSPDGGTLYVTDTGKMRGDESVDDMRRSTIYAFDVDIRRASPFLINRRLFAFVESGVPNAVKCDAVGNVYSGHADGLSVWNAGGLLLGKFKIDGGVSQFCFGRKGELLLLNEHRLIVLTISKDVEGMAKG